jgi:hypothetical protein
VGHPARTPYSHINPAACGKGKKRQEKTNDQVVVDEDEAADYGEGYPLRFFRARGNFPPEYINISEMKSLFILSI